METWKKNENKICAIFLELNMSIFSPGWLKMTCNWPQIIPPFFFILAYWKNSVFSAKKKKKLKIKDWINKDATNNNALCHKSQRETLWAHYFLLSLITMVVGFLMTCNRALAGSTLNVPHQFTHIKWPLSSEWYLCHLI